MKTTRRHTHQINAGSMADIAFLLLIFFLVTAMIPNDQGINRKLPPPCPINSDCNDAVKNRRNILEIKVNSNNELLVENEVIELKDLKHIAKAFLDNNGNGTCGYCQGNMDKTSSDHPKDAVISLTNDQLTTYSFYVKVQDELTKAYYELRDAYAENVLNKPSNSLTTKELVEVKNAYPFILSEAELKN
ncbi:MAG: biopolymer transporter ExbD [Algicola sp.]|nr:biopolymer transporter ExbD [Algicola sp.]